MSDIDTAAADSLKVLDPERPIREADTVRWCNTKKPPRRMAGARIHMPVLGGLREEMPGLEHPQFFIRFAIQQQQ